jgi:signal transduction histidine kinase
MKINCTYLILILCISYTQYSFANDSTILLQKFNEVEKHFFSKGKNIEKLAKEAIELAKKVNDLKRLSKLYRMYGVHLYFSGKYDKALEQYFNSLKICEELNYHKGIVDTYNEIGNLYRKNNQLQKAKDILLKALTIAYQINDSVNIAKTHNNIGVVYETQNELEQSVIEYTFALNIYEKYNDTIGLSYSHENIGAIYLIQKKYNDAEMHFIKSYQYRKNKNMDQASVISLHYLGVLYERLNDIKKAKNYFNLCYELATKINYPDLRQRALLSLSDLYQKNNDFKKALIFYKQSIAIKDSIFNVNQTQQIAEMQALFEVDKKEKENLILIKQNEIEKQNSRNKSNMIIFISVLSFIIFATSILYILRKKELNKIQTQLRINEAEQSQRVRISQDLHDNVGTQLSYVVSHLEMLKNESNTNESNSKKIESIEDMSRNAIQTLRETVWALNNENITIEEFSDKLKSHITKLNRIFDHIRMEIKEDFQYNAILSPSIALHLFRICQESLSNAIKHSCSNHICIQIGNNSNHKFKLKIIDNGIGFNPENIDTKGHYGLSNMKQRASEIGASFVIISHENKGTTVELVLS